MDGTRLNKFISEAGVASRRAADRMIEEGRVTVNGRPAVVGDKVTEEDDVRVDGRRISKSQRDIVIAFNKPRGVTCTSSPDDPDNVISYIGYPERIYSIGRLDKDSEGLLLLTNNGELANAVMRSRSEHEKEYVVTVDHDVTAGFLEAMSSGVEILGRTTKPCEVEGISAREFRIVLRQGLNRQIRRMCGALGYAVVRLVRVRVVNVLLGDLPPGEYRDLTEEERDELWRTTLRG